MHLPVTAGTVPTLVLIALLCSTIGAACSRNTDTDRATNHPAPAESSETSEAQSPQRMTQAALAEIYPQLLLGEVCVTDERCDSPLRCLGGECRFPQAMTGEADESTPHAQILKADGKRLSYSLELAQSRAEQARGLMHREHMQSDFGMLFIFKEEKRQSFWMKNTPLPLDMIFIRRDGVIDTIVDRAAPQSLTARGSRGETLYVLELVGGEAKRQGIRDGDQVYFEGLPSNAKP